MITAHREQRAIEQPSENSINVDASARKPVGERHGILRSRRDTQPARSRIRVRDMLINPAV
ncbi:hypothetical protein GE115_12510 [Agromyces sp. CFH 90414]|uniref:Uncharacterized protein n=1 Tax=Agromyces agglutinans TaxID=2662258 RepID=A0A6I2F8W4_9MICO|nr:hypothetical protein [Agromyces agglutinans]MRG60684.1 hypothetical protein [Agromyces agglutinans]